MKFNREIIHLFLKISLEFLKTKKMEALEKKYEYLKIKVKAIGGREHRHNRDVKHRETRHIGSNKKTPVGIGEDIPRAILWGFV